MLILKLVLSIIFIIVCSFSYRARGGAIPLSNDTLARTIFWFIPITFIVSIICLVLGFPIWISLLSGLLAFGFETIGHSFAQNNDSNAEVEMGLVTFTRLSAILFPFCFFSHTIWFFCLIGILSWLASKLSYSSWFNTRQLKLFGITWCVGGDSSWEELFDGVVFGLTFSSILLLC